MYCKDTSNPKLPLTYLCNNKCQICIKCITNNWNILLNLIDCFNCGDKLNIDEILEYQNTYQVNLILLHKKGF